MVINRLLVTVVMMHALMLLSGCFLLHCRNASCLMLRHLSHWPPARVEVFRVGCDDPADLYGPWVQDIHRPNLPSEVPLVHPI